MDLISVIIPVYNVEKYITKTIESVLIQTYVNFELILVDDGSKDNSGQICDIYSAKDKRVKVIHKQNGGLSSAKNIGLDECNGKYIAFVDSDDYVDSLFIEELYKDIINTGSDISLCNYYKNDCAQIESPFILSENFKYNELFNTYSVHTVVSWNKLYKSFIFNELRFPLKNHEDTYLITDILKIADKISYRLDKCLYHYIFRKNSISNSYNLGSFDNIDAYEKILLFFQKNNISADYSKIKLIICMELCEIFNYINLKSINYKTIKFYKDKYKYYMNDVLNDDFQSIFSKIKVIFSHIFPKIYFFIVKVRRK